MAAAIQEQIAETVARLPEQKKRAVLEFALRLAEEPRDRRERLRSLAGTISSEDGETMLQTIDAECERIDAGSW